MLNLPQATKLPHITPQLHTVSLKNKDVILAAPCYHAKLPDSGRAEGLFRSNSDAEDELQRRSVILALPFLRHFWAAQLAYTHQLAVVWGNRLSHLYSDEIRGNPQAAQGGPHILFFNSSIQ